MPVSDVSEFLLTGACLFLFGESHKESGVPTYDLRFIHRTHEERVGIRGILFFRWRLHCADDTQARRNTQGDSSFIKWVALLGWTEIWASCHFCTIEIYLLFLFAYYPREVIYHAHCSE